MRFLIALTFALIACITPAWASHAEAHPGLHVNPHFPDAVLYLAIGFLALAVGSMLTFLLIRKWRNQAIIASRLRGYSCTDRLLAYAQAPAPVPSVQRKPPYPFCSGNPTIEDCIRAGYCRRDPSCAD